MIVAEFSDSQPTALQSTVEGGKLLFRSALIIGAIYLYRKAGGWKNIRREAEAAVKALSNMSAQR